jgi:hypothetical protein
MRSALVVLGLAALGAGLGGCGPTAGRGAGELLYRVNCAAEKDYVDDAGNVWKADQLWEDGKDWGADDGMTVHRSAIEAVPGTKAPGVYLDERYSMPGYRFKVPAGTYTLHLHFAETYDGISGEGQRVFTVEVEGKPALTDLDVFKEAGGFARPLVRKVTDVEVTDGELNVTFVSNIQNPEINGIEIYRQ